MGRPLWVIFDVGGVLLDWHASSQATAKKLGITRNELFDVLYDQSAPESIGAMMNSGKINPENGWMSVLKQLNLTQNSPVDIINGWFAREFWVPDSLNLIEELKAAGYKLAIMSNSWLGLTDPSKRSAFPIELEFFDHIFDSSVEKLKKPDSRFFELVEQKTGATRNDLLLIDDDKQNIRAAQARQWQTILFEASIQSTPADFAEVRGILLGEMTRAAD